jgi:hypothetical protein
VTSDTEAPDLIAVYERGAALRERLRIAQILEFGMATDRTASAVSLAFRTNVPAYLAIELMDFLVSDAEMLRQQVQNEGTFLRVVKA